MLQNRHIFQPLYKLQYSSNSLYLSKGAFLDTEDMIEDKLTNISKLANNLILVAYGVKNYCEDEVAEEAILVAAEKISEEAEETLQLLVSKKD